MKKLVLIALLPITMLMSGSFVMQKGSPLLKAEDSVPNTTGTMATSETSTITETTLTNVDSTNKITDKYDLPKTIYNVLDYGLKGDGVTDDSEALEQLAHNTNVTNWYFPADHTFRLSNISVPAHVNTIFGEGTIETIMKGTNTRGAFHNLTTTEDHTLYDGLHFTWENKRVDTLYGAISYGNAVSHRNIEIRNCTFRGNEEASHNAILLIGNEETGGLTNAFIHNNQFIDIPRAAIEVLGRNASGNASKDDGSINNVNIYDNTFDATHANDYGHKDGWHCAISFSSSRGGAKAYNNRLINHRWDFEVSDSKDVELYNNYTTGTSEYFLFYNQNASDLNANVPNPVHHNHFESEDCLYGITIQGANGGMPAGEIYENYIKGGPIWLKEGDGGIIRNNTIVKDLTVTTVGPYSAVIKGDAGNSEGFKVIENDIYVYGSDIDAISNRNDESSSSTTQIYNNHIYSSGIGCINMPGADIEGNNCQTSWSGDIPSSRPGAGLQYSTKSY